MASVYDKIGREIMLGDVLKVYHFTGARRKKFYMYKQVLRSILLGSEYDEYLEISHLDVKVSTYNIAKDGSILEDYEIVQGYGEDGLQYFEDRPRATTTKQGD